MKKIIRTAAMLALPLFITALLSWKSFEDPGPVKYTRPVETRITLCASAGADWTDTTAVPAKILPGLGDLRYPVTTKSLKAQEFFEQGLRLVYAFNHWEAIQAFREAIRQDKECAMAYWGLALAYGPNLNDVNPKDRERIAQESIQKAIARKGHVSQVEKDLIDAMAFRYDGKAHDNRDTLNLAYTNAMRAVVKKHPNDPEALTLCADAIMNTMPWDYWQTDGTPKPATAEAKVLLESTLKKFPRHSGAHHLYIHLVEASPAPEAALASAQFLETSMPGAGHIVHMPAHIYLRTGQYARAIDLNVLAVKVDEEYLRGSANRGMYRLSYYPHNVDFISYGAYMDGRSALGIQTALKLAYKGNMIATTNPLFAQYFGVEPILAYVRFGKWDEILSLPDPDNNLMYAQVLHRFARGLASLRTGQLQGAMNELHQLDSLCKLDTLQQIYFTFNPVSDIAKVPHNILKGEVLIKQGRSAEGLAALQQAVQAETALRYVEPPDWKIPSRHFLGAALFDAGKFAEAEQVYLDDLKVNRENGWALTGLQQCQARLGKKTDATATAKRLSKAWKNADVSITTSRY